MSVYEEHQERNDTNPPDDRFIALENLLLGSGNIQLPKNGFADKEAADQDSVGLENIAGALHGVKSHLSDSLTAFNEGTSRTDQAGLCAAVSPETSLLEGTKMAPELEAELVHLYFDTVNVLCPVLKRSEFLMWYSQRRENDSSNPKSVVLKAILFASFAYTSSVQVEQSPFQSVPQGQKALFQAARAAYHESCTAHMGKVALVQAAVILTFWSPYDSSKEVNLYWLDEAFRHALLAGFDHVPRGYNKVIWWCCMVRSRFMSSGLRRSYKPRSHGVESGLKEADFEIDEDPKCDVPKTKLRFRATLFLLLTRLAEIMGRVQQHNSMSTRRGALNEREWTTLQLDDLRDVIEIDADLEGWRRTFDQAMKCQSLAHDDNHGNENIHFLSILHQ